MISHFKLNLELEENVEKKDSKAVRTYGVSLVWLPLKVLRKQFLAHLLNTFHCGRAGYRYGRKAKRMSLGNLWS
jgi:hypothetical protein